MPLYKIDSIAGNYITLQIKKDFTYNDLCNLNFREFIAVLFKDHYCDAQDIEPKDKISLTITNFKTYFTDVLDNYYRSKLDDTVEIYYVSPNDPKDNLPYFRLAGDCLYLNQSTKPIPSKKKEKIFRYILDNISKYKLGIHSFVDDTLVSESLENQKLKVINFNSNFFSTEKLFFDQHIFIPATPNILPSYKSLMSLVSTKKLKGANKVEKFSSLAEEMYNDFKKNHLENVISFLNRNKINRTLSDAIPKFTGNPLHKRFIDNNLNKSKIIYNKIEKDIFDSIGDDTLLFRINLYIAAGYYYSKGPTLSKITKETYAEYLEKYMNLSGKTINCNSNLCKPASKEYSPISGYGFALQVQLSHSQFNRIKNLEFEIPCIEDNLKEEIINNDNLTIADLIAKAKNDD